MDKELEGTRGGKFPFDDATVQAARHKLAPPSISEIKEMFGRVTVGSSHPTGDHETNVDTRPTISFDDAPTPSDDSPPSVEEALAAKQEAKGALKTFKSGKRYQVLLNKRVEFEKDLWLSPNELHTVDGAFASKHKADIDAATEVAE